jgi:hypothetical protein
VGSAAPSCAAEADVPAETMVRQGKRLMRVVGVRGGVRSSLSSGAAGSSANTDMDDPMSDDADQWGDALPVMLPEARQTAYTNERELTVKLPEARQNAFTNYGVVEATMA